MKDCLILKSADKNPMNIKERDGLNMYKTQKI